MEQDLNRTLRDADFKDATPMSTVERIKGILRLHGIETEEYWNVTGVPYCFGITIRVAGTTFSVNGKGLTREFALASGYGELMERLQLGFIGKFDVQKDGHHTADTSRFIMCSPQMLMEATPDWYDRIAARLYQETGTTITPAQILEQCAEADGRIATDLFYDLTTGQTVNFPKTLWSRVYSSNGCAAGNSMEEALVQALSEIVERQYRTRIVVENIHVPDIPEDFLRQFEVSYNIINYVRDHGFRVVVKDCSLGGKFPVVCVCFIDQNTGRYHTHFGAYPIFEIALARALTETFQGRNISEIAAFTDFTRTGSRDDMLLTMKHEFVRGTWEKPAGFFVGQPTYPFHDDVGFQGKNNKELLRECLAFFTDQGYQIMVRDGSSLGFHTYQVLIPGYSEVFTYRLNKKLNEFRYFNYAVKTLRNPSLAGFDDMLGLMMHMEQIKSSIGTHSFLAGSKLSAELTPRQEDQMMRVSLAYVRYAMGQYDAVVRELGAIIDCYKDEKAAYLICLKRYLSMKEQGIPDAGIRSALEFFHDAETVEKLYRCLDAGQNPLEEFVLHCDGGCRADCPIYSQCRQIRTTELTKLINSKITELDFNAFCQSLKGLV